MNAESLERDWEVPPTLAAATTIDRLFAWRSLIKGFRLATSLRLLPTGSRSPASQPDHWPGLQTATGGRSADGSGVGAATFSPADRRRTRHADSTAPPEPAHRPRASPALA